MLIITYLKKVLPDFFDETGWIIKEGYLKVGQQIFFATGDYFMGASNFANAAKLAKKQLNCWRNSNESSIWW
ncbi:MAG: hypothetical protein ACLU5J_05855 [Christensenellales bacterium]